jgi:hypothetical protein
VVQGPCLSINADVANGTFFNSDCPLQPLAVKITGDRDPADLIQQALVGKREEEDASHLSEEPQLEVGAKGF